MVPPPATPPRNPAGQQPPNAPIKQPKVARVPIVGVRRNLFGVVNDVNGINNGIQGLSCTLSNQG